MPVLDHRNVYRQTSAHSASRRWGGHRNVYQPQASPRSSVGPCVGYQTPVVASLLWLSHDEVETLAAELASPLVPGPAVNLSSSCHEMRMPMQGPLAVLKEQHERAKELCVQVNMRCQDVCAAEELVWYGGGLTPAHCKTLGMLARTHSLPNVSRLPLFNNAFGDDGMRAFCSELGRASLPSLVALAVGGNNIGAPGAASLGGALGEGALGALESLSLTDNAIGDKGLAALAAPLRKLRRLGSLSIINNQIGDEGIVALLNPIDGPLPALTTLYVQNNAIGDEGCRAIAAAIDAGDAGVLPALRCISVSGNPACHSALAAVTEAASRARRRDERQDMPASPQQ